MRTYRRLHLWVGLVCCLLILMESLTGLLISESWLSLGQFTEHRLPAPGAALTASQEDAAPDALARSFHPDTVRNGIFAVFNPGIPSGRFGGNSMKRLAEASAIGIIIMTSAGIVLSLRALRGQSLRKQKRLPAAAESEQA